jgi:hypothetical protein
MIPRDVQAASLVSYDRYESPSAWHEDNARTWASKLGWSYLSLVQWREVTEPFNQSRCLYTIYCYTFNTQTSLISLHPHFYMQTQQHNIFVFATSYRQANCHTPVYVLRLFSSIHPLLLLPTTKLPKRHTRDYKATAVSSDTAIIMIRCTTSG